MALNLWNRLSKRKEVHALEWEAFPGLLDIVSIFLQPDQPYVFHLWCPLELGLNGFAMTPLLMDCYCPCTQIPYFIISSTYCRRVCPFVDLSLILIKLENSSSTNWIFSLQKSISKFFDADYTGSKSQLRKD